MLLITLNENTLSLSPGNQVIFPHQTWEDYERLLSLRLQKTILIAKLKKFGLCLLYQVMANVSIF